MRGLNEKRNEFGRKAGVLSLSLVLAVSLGLGVNAYAGRPASAETKTATQKAVEKNFPEIARQTAAKTSVKQGTVPKDETVYVVMDADGGSSEVTVNEWLKGLQKGEVKDTSTLKGVENVSGDEKFSQDGDALTWTSKGRDIQYKGSADASDLPVTVAVSYYLNGKKVSASEIAGKSGNVEIHFDYSVNRMEITGSGGNGYTIPHPYTMASGVMLDDDHFSDVTVSTGKAVNDGSKTVVVGIAFPGLKDSLGLNTASLDIPESVVVKAKTDKFTMDGTYSVALSGLLADLDTGSASSKVTSKVEELESGLTELSDASKELVNGTNKLKEGTASLKDGTSQLSDGTGPLAKGAGSLITGADKLNVGAAQLYAGTQKLVTGGSKLQTGANELNAGLGKLSANSETLRSATDQLENSIFTMVTQTLQETLKTQYIAAGMSEDDAKKAVSDVVLTPKDYTQKLSEVAGKSLTAATAAAKKELLSQTKAGAKKLGYDLTNEQANAIISLAYMDYTAAHSGGVTTISAKAAQEQIQTSSQKAILGMTVATGVQKILSDSNMKTAIAQQLQTTDQDKITAFAVSMVMAQQQGVTDPTQLMQAAGKIYSAGGYQEAVKAMTELQTAQKNADTNVTAFAAKVAAGSDALVNGNKQLKAVQAQLDQVVSYCNGVRTYIAGVDSAYAGSQNLTSGVKELNNGISKVNDGAKQLADGTKSLAGGAKQLSDGASKVDAGAKKLDSGASDLDKGAGELAAGMYKFDRDGIQKLVSSLNATQLKNVANRFDAVTAAADRTYFIGGVSNGMTGESKIIYKTDEVK